jgi:fermentation-respiration switch protein FrsA (DUF1100 family)
MFMEQKNLYYPSRDIPASPANINLPYEEVYFRTRDGETLHAWFIMAKKPAATVLYCHGNAGNISHRLHRVKFFNDMGINVLIFDYRGYGKSSGRPGEKGLYHDAQAAYDYLIAEKNIKSQDLMVYGKSLGGAVAVDLCLKREVGKLILESTFASSAEVAKEIYPFLPLTLLLTQKYNSLKKIDKISIPKLIVHGRDDEIIKFRHSKMLYEKAAEPKKHMPFTGGHNDEVFVTSKEYRDIIKQFLLAPVLPGLVQGGSE